MVSFAVAGAFFNTLDAGSQLYEQMRTVLREPAPDSAVLTCFHRVLMLGFLGGYHSVAVPEREQLVSQLTARVPAFSFSPSGGILATASSRNRLGSGCATGRYGWGWLR